MKRLLFLLAGLILLCNCEREKSPQVMILVTSNDTLTNCKPGDSILFHIHSSAVDDLVKNITIASADMQYGYIQVLDTMLNVESCNLDYYYIVPEFTDTTSLELTFKAFSSSRVSTSSYSLSLMVNPMPIEKDSLPILYNNRVLYGCGRYSGGFNLEYLTNNLSDVSLMDIYDLCDNSDTLYLLSRNWGSNTGIQFVRFNQFDFASATVEAIETIFNNSSPSNFIYDVQVGDVIFVGKNQKALGVIQIATIYDVSEEQNNRYIFHYKKIK